MNYINHQFNNDTNKYLEALQRIYYEKYVYVHSICIIRYIRQHTSALADKYTNESHKRDFLNASNSATSNKNVSLSEIFYQKWKTQQSQIQLN